MLSLCVDQWLQSALLQKAVLSLTLPLEAWPAFLAPLVFLSSPPLPWKKGGADYLINGEREALLDVEEGAKLFQYIPWESYLQGTRKGWGGVMEWVMRDNGGG